MLTSWPGDAATGPDPSRAVKLHRPGGADGRPVATRPPRRYPAVWAPILPREQWEAVRVILSDPRRRLNLGDNRFATPLAGLAWCGACEAAGVPTRLVSAPMRPGRADRRLKCARTGCGKVARAVTPVERYVRELVAWWLGDGGAYAAHVAALRATGAAGRAAARIEAIDEQIASCRARIGQAEDAAAREGDLSLAVGIIGRIRAEIDTLAAERTEARRQAAAAARPAADHDGGAGVNWPALDAHARRDWLRLYVDRVIIGPAAPGSPRQWFDPACVVQVIPGPWAAGLDPAALAPPAELAAVTRPPAAPPRGCDLAESYGCTGLHDANGLCRLHNRRRWEAIRAGRDPEDYDHSPHPHRGREPGEEVPRGCDASKDGSHCPNGHEAHGLCSGHLQRKRKAEAEGHPDDWDRGPLGRGGRSRHPGCTATPDGGEPCGEQVHGDGLCSMHWQRRAKARRRGDPDGWDRGPRRPASTSAKQLRRRRQAARLAG